MPNVAVDIGNTRIKSALFEEEELISTATHTNLEELIAHYSANTHHWVFGSVKHYDEQIKKIFYKEKYEIRKMDIFNSNQILSLV